MVGLDEFDRSVVEFITTFKKINKKPSSINYFSQNTDRGIKPADKDSTSLQRLSDIESVTKLPI